MQSNRKNSVSLMSMLAASLAIAPMRHPNPIMIRERRIPRAFTRIANVGRWLSSRTERGARNPTPDQSAKTLARKMKRQRDYVACCLSNKCLPETPIFFEFYIPF